MFYRSQKKPSKRSHSVSSDSSIEESKRTDDKIKSSKSNSDDREKRRERSRSRHRSRSRSTDKQKKDKHSKSDRKKRSKRSSSSESEQSDSSLKLLQKLEAKRLQEAVERKNQKEALKALETPEVKRARRLREKQAKELKRRERMGWDTEYQHYTNEDNPFGDANLTQTFVWKKKLEQKGLSSLGHAEIEMLNRQKQLENKAELEKVKKRRQERELERAERDEEMVLLQRSREAAEFKEWERQEDQFHLEQARLRSKIRIQDGRAKPIDLLAQYVSTHNLEETIEMQMHEPYTYLNGLSAADLDDLIEDIRIYVDMDKNMENIAYWEDLTIIATDELQKMRKAEIEGEFQSGNREGINQSVANDVTKIFHGKSAHQLSELRLKIESKITSKSDGVDVSYWESLLSQLKAHMARARLRDQHHENLRSKLAILKREQAEVDEMVEAERINMEEPSTSTQMDVDDEDTELSQMNESEKDTVDLLTEALELYDKGNYTPQYISEEDVDRTIQIIDSDTLQSNIEKVRRRVMNREECDDDDFATREEMRMAREARQGMNEDGAVFSVETKVENEVYLWSDKYRPRKPRYFNRVHTGFEWNKYNQTHYDMDNPPPKIVQGYKFNIFYPDLIDKGSTPQYFLVSYCSILIVISVGYDFIGIVFEHSLKCC